MDEFKESGDANASEFMEARWNSAGDEAAGAVSEAQFAKAVDPDFR